MTDRTLRVVVIDDSAFNRRTITSILSNEKDIEVVGEATDGEEGLKVVADKRPDLITLDVEMPRMDGFTFLRLVMSQFPTPVLMVSSHSRKHEVFQALELGALDFIAKPERFLPDDTRALRDDLLTKVRAVRSLQRVAFDARPGPTGAPNRRQPDLDKKPTSSGAPTRILCVGSSTGGPPALQSLLTVFDSPRTAVLVCQHMPEKFTRAFAERLNRLAPMSVVEGLDGDVLEGGKAYVAPGGFHMELKSGGDEKLRILTSEPSPSDKYVPSVDKLFRSIATYATVPVMGLVLTGMGDDGKVGVVALKEVGARVLVESPETAIVYGMPKEAKSTGCVDMELPLPELVEMALAFSRETGA